MVSPPGGRQVFLEEK